MKKFKISFFMLVAILVLSIGTIAMAAKPVATPGVGFKAKDADTVIVSANVSGAAYSQGSVYPAEVQWDIYLVDPGLNGVVGGYDNTAKAIKLDSDDVVVGQKLNSATNNVEFDGVVAGGKYFAVVVAKDGATTPAQANAYVTAEAYVFSFDPNYNGNNPVDKYDTVALDNDIPNANGTGVNGMAKGISGHKTHGDYKNNTNSCASCHQTHTGASSTLLFKETAEEACIACHDGTGMTIYNVFPTSMAKDNGSGTFAGTKAGNMSVHLTDESVDLSAAPGSNLKIQGTSWAGEFSCDTCHNPHGSYSSRLLQTNTAGFMNVERTYAGGTPGTTTYVAPKQWYGGLFRNVSIVDLTTDTVKDFGTAEKSPVGDFSVAGIPNNSVFAKIITLNKGWIDPATSKLAESDATISAIPGDNIVLTGDPTTGKQKIDTTNTTYKLFDPSKALQDGKELFLVKYKVTAADVAVGGYYEKTGLAEGATIYQFVKKLDGGSFYQRIPFNTVANNKADFTATGVTKFDNLNNIKGYFVTTDTPTAIKDFRAFNIVRLPQVATGLGENGVQETKTPWYAWGADGKSSLVTSASTVAYAQWCGTCHVDYASNSGYATTADNGKNSYHHTANSTSSGRSCAFCHYAHGTDVTFMRDAVGNTVESLVATGDISLPTPVPMTTEDAIAYLKDKNPSSALKRYTNMSVCYGCHVSSHYAGLGNNGQTGPGSSLGLGANGLPTVLPGGQNVWK